MRCIYPYAANESTHNNEARRNAILFIQTTPLLTTLKLYTLENDVRSIEKSGNAFLSSNFLVKSAATSTELTIGLSIKLFLVARWPCNFLDLVIVCGQLFLP